MIKPGTILQDRYLVGKQIGSGGMGAVYLAIDHRFENQVAIKETFFNDAALSDAFEREARLLNNLHHPVLPHVSDFFTEDEAYFLVMEYIEGDDLSEILQAGNPLPAADVLRWSNQMLDALDYLHSQNPPIIHRDIKPHNLKITPRGDVILLDFGLAKLETLDQQEERSIFGYSRTYSPLEQIEGTGTDARSDIFSLAATGYHLLTGQPPVSALKRAAAIVAGQPDPLQLASDFNPQINPALAHILETALALDPNERYGSARAMQTAIEYALDENTEPDVEVSTGEQQAEIDAFTVPLDNKVKETSFPALAAFAAEAAHDSAVTTEVQLEHETAAEDNREDYYSAPFSVTVTDNQPTSIFKKLIPVAVLLFILAGGLIVWSFAIRKDVPNEQAQFPIVQETESLPVEAEPLPIAESFDEKIMPKSALTEQNIISNKQEEKTESIRQNVLPAALTKKNNRSSEKEKEIIAPGISVPKETKPPVDSKPKSASKSTIASTKVIIVPSAGLTRPRVISKNPPAKGRESSASEINRFLIGRP